jgi:hypothetical protein
MKKWIIVLFVLCFAMSVFGIDQMAFAKRMKLRTKMIKLNELPQTKFEVTRYSSVSGAKAYVLTIPGGDVKIAVDKPSITKTDEGLNTPQAYIDSFGQKPKAYRFENKEDGTVYGYMLYAVNINWLANIDKSGEIINIKVMGAQEDQP